MKARQPDVLDKLPSELRGHVFSFMDATTLSRSLLVNSHWNFFAKPALKNLRNELSKLDRTELIARCLADRRTAKLILDIDLTAIRYQLLMGDLLEIAKSHADVAIFMLTHPRLFTSHRFRNGDCLTDLCLQYFSVAQVVFNDDKLYGLLNGAQVKQMMGANTDLLGEIIKRPLLLRKMNSGHLQGIAEIIQSPEQAIIILNHPKLSKKIGESDLLTLGIKFVEAALDIIANRNDFEGDFYMKLGLAHIEATQKILENIDLLNKIPMSEREKLEEKAFDYAIYASYKA